MVRLTGLRGVVSAVGIAVATIGLTVTSASAQGVDPNPGAFTLTGTIDFTNAYLFRGIPQDETKVIMWPYADLGIALSSGDGAVKSVGVNVGLWNSLHTGAAGLDGPSGKLWYESDFYATFALGFGGGVGFGTTYTAYTSPNNAFATVQEIAFKVSAGAVVKPYALLAIELDGQADGGVDQGTYLELGVGPSFSASGFTLTIPAKVGLSLGGYYEGLDGDEGFGFFSVAGNVSKSITDASSRFGSWNVHGGVEYLILGERNELILGKSSKVVGSVGLGFSY